MKYVVLATDSAPTYAVWAPVAIRLWAKHGYRTILFVERNPLAWGTLLGRNILRESRDAGALILAIRRTGHLTVANTMRCSRLVAAACGTVQPEDFILTSDVDMMPLQRGFFEREEQWIVLRAMFSAFLDAKVMPLAVDLDQIRPGCFRFAMCYCGATAAIWRTLFPEIVIGHPERSLAHLVSDLADQTDWDEILVSRRFLQIDDLVELIDEAGVWRKGALTLVEPLTLPLLSAYFNMPRGMLRLEDFWRPGLGTPAPPEAIDYIPHRFNSVPEAFRGFDVIAAYFPEERAWLDHYRSIIDPLL